MLGKISEKGIWVPNAPCGVESIKQLGFSKAYEIVPNAPCGVESLLSKSMISRKEILFLMHRVELKGCYNKH